MQPIVSFVLAHRTIAALLGYYFASAFLGSLQAPDATSSKLYRFLFTFANTFAANLTRAFATKLPSGAVNTAANAAVEPPMIRDTSLGAVHVTVPGVDPQTAAALRSKTDEFKKP